MSTRRNAEKCDLFISGEMKKTAKATKRESRGRKSRRKLKWKPLQVSMFLKWFKQKYNKDGDKREEDARRELANHLIEKMKSRRKKPDEDSVCRAIQGAVSKKNREPLPKHYEIPLCSLMGLADSAALFPHLASDELASDAPLKPLPFRNIRHKRWQEIRLNESPHPTFINKGPPPFLPLPSDEVCYVEGWILCLRANVRYRITFYFGTNGEWRETEIVFYQRVPKTAVWERDISCGSVTEGGCLPEFMPQSEHWMITAWGKHVIDREAPWHSFVPKTQAQDTTKASLKLDFLSPQPQDGDGGLPAPAEAVESSPAILMEVVV